MEPRLGQTSEYSSQIDNNSLLWNGDSVKMSMQRDDCRITLFGEIAKLDDFAGREVHIEFWLELPEGWSPMDYDDHSLYGLTQRCYSSSSITHVGCPFQLTIVRSERQSNDAEMIRGFQMYFRIVNNHNFGRTSTEAFGILGIPCRPGHYVRKVETFRPISNRVADKLLDHFLNYSFDLDDLEENKYEPVGMLFTESKGSISVNFNVVIQSNQSSSNLDEASESYDVIWSDISQIVAAFRRARQRMIWLKIKALEVFKNRST